MTSKRSKAGVVVVEDGYPLSAHEQPVHNARAHEEPAAVWMDTASLTPWDRNPRRNDANVERVAESIKRFGFAAPIVARAADHTIIAGHTRWKAAKLLGLDRVPVRLLTLDPAEAHLLALADNRLNELSPWDTAELQRILSDYGLEDAAMAGWSSSDLETMASELLAGTEPPAEVVEDEAPEPPKEAVTKPGDVWLLGKHRLLCGDSTSRDAWTRLMGEQRADAMWTDPPYGVSYTGTATKARDGIENDALDDDDLAAFVGSVFDSALAFCGPGASWYVAVPAGPPEVTFLVALKDRGVLRQSLVWVKDHFSLGRSDYHYKHEPILYGWTPGAAHYFVDERTHDSVLSFPKPSRSEEHPTMKPVALVAQCIRNSTRAGALVVEPFGGSGTTLIACEQLGRVCNAIELDPRYCDVIVKRWEALTGDKAVRDA